MEEIERITWRKASEVFGQLVELPTKEREAALQRLELSPAEHARVRELLDSATDKGLLDGQLEELASDSLAKIGWDEGLSGRILGGWKLGSLLGRGGMAAVYRAQREGRDFEQIAAVKLLNLVLRGTAEQKAFRRERQILARLQHPNIASLLDGGIAEDGTPYLVMELVEGDRIDDYCDRHQSDIRMRVGLMVDVCKAVGYAHRKLVLHRDLKPGNILVDQRGQIKLLDFGVGKLIDDEEPVTRTMLRAFTPEYAAPEQLSGDEASTTQTDVYALGGLLCHLLTGKLPSESGKALGEVNKDLATVVDKCLREEPEHRYQSAEALADDLCRWLENRPVQAMPASMSYRFGKLIRRRAAPLAAAALVFLALIGGIAGTSWQAYEARIQAERAEAQARRAETVRDFLASVLNSAQRSRGVIPDALDILDAGSERARQELLANDPLAAGDVLTVTGAARYTLSDFDGALADLQDAINAFSPLQPQPAAELSQLHWEMGRLLRVRGPAVDAGEHYRQALEWAILGDLPEEKRLEIEVSKAAWMNEHADPRQAEARLGPLIERIESRMPNSSVHLSALNAMTTAMALGGQDLLDQIQWHERRLEVATALYGANDGWTAYTLADAMPTFRNAGLPERAMEIGQQAVAIADLIYSEPDALAVVVYCNMGSLYRHLGRHREALEIYERYAAMDRELMRANLHAESCWFGYARSLLLNGEIERARDALLQAHGVLERMGTEYQVNLLNLCAVSALTAQVTGALDRAQQLLDDCRHPDWNESLARALDYRIANAEMALLAGEFDRASNELTALRASNEPTANSLVWLRVWLPSWWLVRETGPANQAEVIHERIVTMMPEMAAGADAYPTIQRCLAPTSSLTDCINVL